MDIKSPTITAHEDTAKTKLDGIATELGIEKPNGAKSEDSKDSKDSKESARKEGTEGGFVDEDDSGLSPDDKS